MATQRARKSAQTGWEILPRTCRGRRSASGPAGKREATWSNRCKARERIAKLERELEADRKDLKKNKAVS